MATIRKRGNLQWEVRVRHKGHPTQSKTFCTKAEGEAWAAVIESEMARGVFISRTESEKTTLAECLKRYLAEITPNKKGAEHETYKIGIILKHKVCNHYMASVRGADLAQYRDDRLKEVKGATVSRELAILSNLFNVARKEWGMENLTNPVEVVRKPKPPRGRDRRLQEGELEAILAASESPQLSAIILLAIETAMRRGELVSLTWSNVRLKERHLLLPDTKNGEARAVPLSSKAVTLLERLPRSITGKVFNMRADSVTQAFERTRDRALATYLAGCKEAAAKPTQSFLTNLRFHDLRHEATSRFFEIGLNPIEAASITGHKDLRMLQRYTHLKAENLAKKLG